MPRQHQHRIEGVRQFAPELHIAVFNARRNAVQRTEQGSVVRKAWWRTGAAQHFEQHLFPPEGSLDRRDHGRETGGEFGIGQGAQGPDAAAQGFAIAVQRGGDHWPGEAGVSK